MITPDEDFDTWILIMTSTVSDMLTFEPFIDQIETLLTELVENQKFSSEKIVGKEQQFIRECYHKVIPKLKQFRSITNEEKLLIINLIEIFLKFGIDSIDKNSLENVLFISQLIPDPSWPLIEMNKEITK